MKSLATTLIARQLTALLLVCLTACSGHEGSSLQSQYVVEGWIEAGEFPMVRVTRSIPITEEYQSLDSLERYIVRWGTVSVSDGTREVILTGKSDNRFFPPYIYTTTEMRGQPGYTYQLTIRRDDGPDIVARCTVPDTVGVDSFAVVPVTQSDTLVQLYAYLHVAPQPTTYYKVFAKEGDDTQDFLPSYLGVIRSDMMGPGGRIAVNKGRTNLQKDFTPYFTREDTVMLRIARIDSVAYEFWRSYEDMLSLSRIPLFPNTVSLPSSVSGAYGFWQGWGATYHTVVIGNQQRTQTIKQTQ